MFPDRVLSGMRPSGRLHIGHYHGALKNWVRLQDQYPCFFFVADWHALTTNYDRSSVIQESIWDMLIDWLAAGIDPEKATIFIQSQVMEHAELSLLLGMGTPVAWLERVPTYKDQQQKLSDRDLATYGFLGYPLMQAADILIYRANLVPVGEDQVSHLELSREVARRFNHLYGARADFEKQVEAALRKLLPEQAKAYQMLRVQYQEQGQHEALAQGKARLTESGLTAAERHVLWSYLLAGDHAIVLPEPRPLLTDTPKLPGLDGQKMSKSYNNSIYLRDDPQQLTQKIKTMKTDPARARRHDPGDPERCPVWPLHKIYSSQETQQWVQQGCTTAGIGCLECKKPVIDALLQEQEGMHERAQPYLQYPERLREVVAAGCQRAKKAAQETMEDVRAAMGLQYS